MSVFYKSKSELRTETEDALQVFLARGGVVEVVKPSRRKPKQTMSCKSSRGFQSGTSGFATGYPRKSTV